VVKNRYKIFIFSILLIIGICFAKFKTADYILNIDSFEKVGFIIEESDENTLVIFDVDETLIQANDAGLQRKNSSSANEILEELKEKYPKLKTEEFDSYIRSIVMQQAIREIIEPYSVNFIKSLQEKGIKTIALTKMRTGSYGKLMSEKWRADGLKKLGVNFDKAFNENLVFNKFKAFHGSYPVFYQGILCTNNQSKGDVLGAFLDAIQFKPSKVIFFDDLEEQLISVAKEMERRKISFQGYRYLGGEPKTKKLDVSLAKFQLNYLVENHRWLNDQDAKKLHDNAL